jgi:hypothetical protein
VMVMTYRTCRNDIHQRHYDADMYAVRACMTSDRLADRPKTASNAKIKKSSGHNFTIRLTLQNTGSLCTSTLHYLTLLSSTPHSSNIMPMPKCCIICSAASPDLQLCTAMLASPPCIVPGLVRGSMEAAAQANQGS